MTHTGNEGLTVPVPTWFFIYGLADSPGFGVGALEVLCSRVRSGVEQLKTMIRPFRLVPVQYRVWPHLGIMSGDFWDFTGCGMDGGGW